MNVEFLHRGLWATRWLAGVLVATGSFFVACSGSTTQVEAPPRDEASPADQCQVPPEGSLVSMDWGGGRLLLVGERIGEVDSLAGLYPLYRGEVAFVDGDGCLRNTSEAGELTMPIPEDEGTGAPRIESRQLGPDVEVALLFFTRVMEAGETESMVAVMRRDDDAIVTSDTPIVVRRDAMGPPVFYSEESLRDTDGDGIQEMFLNREGMGTFVRQVILRLHSGGFEVIEQGETPSAESGGPVGSSASNPVRVCGAGDEHRWLAQEFQCPDGSNPFPTQDSVSQLAPRGSMMGDQHLVDRYQVPCPGGVVTVFLDMYGCDEGPEAH